VNLRARLNQRVPIVCGGFRLSAVRGVYRRSAIPDRPPIRAAAIGIEALHDPIDVHLTETLPRDFREVSVATAGDSSTQPRHTISR